MVWMIWYFKKIVSKPYDGALKVQRTDQHSIIADIELHKKDEVVGNAKLHGKTDLQQDTVSYISALVKLPSTILPLLLSHP